MLSDPQQGRRRPTRAVVRLITGSRTHRARRSAGCLAMTDGLVRSLVQQIGGEIDVRNDAGLVVTISFPEAAQQIA